MHRRITGLVTVMMVVGLATAACMTPSAVAASKRKAPRPTVKALTGTAQAHLLSLSDLPSGWSINNTTTKKGGLGATKCLSAFKHSNKKFAHATVSFEENSNVPLLEELLATGTGVGAAYAKAAKALSSCKSLTLTAKGKTLHGTIGQMSFPTVAAKSTAYALGVTITGIHVGFDLVMFKVQKYVGLVGYADIGTPNITTAVAFAKEAVAKAEGQAVSPPSAGGTGSST